MKELILVVEDNPDILELLEYNLLSAGYETLGFLNTKNVKQALSEEKIDLIIMDRTLPDIEGSLFIEMLRSKDIDTPVIFLSGKNSVEEIKDGFLKGADDYITKPFDIGELILRVKAVLKRYKNDSKNSLEILKYRDIHLDLNLHSVTIDNRDANLTKLETSLLQVMILNKGKVLDREFLLKNIWSDPSNIHEKTVNVAIKRLKEKIDPLRDKEYIRTIRGVGYLLP
ncbi:MAG: response regulator transcription factor [Sulfurimonas sp.]|nr:response regulator transcription factor [Sulfurimonas sp.]MBU1217028.1 response regulator transcription factor [bacterium]MBU1435413.1 response regulator transcription factor [bacterium]MBU1502276.1 response regulator transcription factor [bacterium]MBU3940216.1 response regulator transcription factor [bacterium]